MINSYTSKSEDINGESDSEVPTADADLIAGDTHDTLSITSIPPMYVLRGYPYELM